MVWTYIPKTYDPKSKDPFRISRTKIEDFLKCPRCFYLDRRKGVGRPGIPGFSLNNAVDELLKKEFDLHRAENTAHPLMAAYHIDAVPFQHAKMEEWRDAMRRGITFLHPATNLNITGGIDDVWQDKKGQLIIVDYKATATDKEISLDDEYKQGYKKQVEIYQWLFRQNGFDVSPTAYFVFCNGRRDKQAFDGKLEFDLSIIAHEGNDAWIEPTILEIKKTLDDNNIPAASPACELCNYVKNTNEKEKNI